MFFQNPLPISISRKLYQPLFPVATFFVPTPKRPNFSPWRFHKLFIVVPKSCGPHIFFKPSLPYQLILIIALQPVFPLSMEMLFRCIHWSCDKCRICSITAPAHPSDMHLGPMSVRYWCFHPLQLVAICPCAKLSHLMTLWSVSAWWSVTGSRGVSLQRWQTLSLMYHTHTSTSTVYVSFFSSTPLGCVPLI